MTQALISRIHGTLSANQNRDSEFNIYNNTGNRSGNYSIMLCLTG